jgi:hypothetical protein
VFDDEEEEEDGNPVAVVDSKLVKPEGPRAPYPAFSSISDTLCVL